MRLLYQKHQDALKTNRFVNDFLRDAEILSFSPSLFKLKFKNENISFSECIMRLYFGFITNWKYEVYFLFKSGEKIHSSYVIPRCYKFPFLSDKEFEIGPCVTDREYRGKGCYKYVLEHITNSSKYSKALFYMIVSDSNLASVRGIEGAGFEKCGTVRKTNVLKKYIRE